MNPISIPEAEARAVHAILEGVAPELAATFSAAVTWKTKEGTAGVVVLKCTDEFLETMITALTEGQLHLAPGSMIDDFSASELPGRVDEWLVVWTKENQLKGTKAAGAPESQIVVTTEVQVVPLP